MYPTFKDNIWGADLADMQLISKFNKGFRFLLCVIDYVINLLVKKLMIKILNLKLVIV